MTARRVFYSGRVQGVGFRFSSKQTARGYDVCGWVKNLPDGRVELHVQAWELARWTPFSTASRKAVSAPTLKNAMSASWPRRPACGVSRSSGRPFQVSCSTFHET